ncbi:DUF488 family protein [Cellulomonas sp. NTE-D12]|uniref:DUF488 domain-containing protein n=1 Tax=Cellulomonas sp. NTE-D12 TaxID=2962632 RepID=UPI003081CAA5|nr:hypothetical protein CELD12_25230 [Cellulomonas sp. NTE-D12]
MSGVVRIKRVYDDPAPEDGYRVLVDRLWPRGVSRERAAVGTWLKQIAPSAKLRTWWDHDPARLDEFTARYGAELQANPALDELHRLLHDHPVVTLVYSARDPHLNQAQVLSDYLAAPSETTGWRGENP